LVVVENDQIFDRLYAFKSQTCRCPHGETMTQLEERSFVHNGKTFLLRLFGTGSGFSVVAFLSGQQVSPSYGVSFETHADYFMQHKARLTDHLFEIAKSDIEQEMYYCG
jgi:hypothetical protein